MSPMLTDPFLKKEFKPNLIYIVKCLIGVIICYVLYVLFPQYPFYWAIVSVVLALSEDNSNKQAYNRIKANVLGCAVGLCLYPLQWPNLLILCLGVALTIYTGIALNIKDTLRSALAAFIIVTIQVDQGKHWFIALERVMCVVVGCMVALLITLLFNLISQNKQQTITGKK
jgi:uncharacterized membrane protein YgaE (UPF0421/DUF939 family)